jgi:hypothetical protein
VARLWRRNSTSTSPTPDHQHGRPPNTSAGMHHINKSSRLICHDWNARLLQTRRCHLDQDKPLWVERLQVQSPRVIDKSARTRVEPPPGRAYAIKPTPRLIFHNSLSETYISPFRMNVFDISLSRACQGVTISGSRAKRRRKKKMLGFTADRTRATCSQSMDATSTP